MNSWKLNSIANYLLRLAICEGLDIPMQKVYKTVESADLKGNITLKDGRVFKLTLTEIKKP